MLSPHLILYNPSAVPEAEKRTSAPCENLGEENGLDLLSFSCKIISLP